MVVRVPEPTQASPCRHCHGTHPDHSCPQKMREEDMWWEAMEVLDEMKGAKDDRH